MKRRNIAVFFDGTGQCRDYLPTYRWSNVALLFDALDMKGSSGVMQSRKYIDGVGTRKGEELSGGGLGIGLDARVEEACDFLCQEFCHASKKNEEPHVYIFGFSRGAFAARWLASLLDLSGVSKGRPTPRKLFVNHKKQDRKAAKALIDAGKVFHPVNVDFLGVWDTVKASIDKIKGIDVVPKCVTMAYHALAVDEWRRPFSPTRFQKSTKVTEVWFPGSHTDVGGGYEIRTLADRPLWWMVQGSIKRGLLVDEAALEESVARLAKSAAFHDELSNSILWKGLNGGGKKVFRNIEPDDIIDDTVRSYVNEALSDRQCIPDSCEVVDTKKHDKKVV